MHSFHHVTFGQGWWGDVGATFIPGFILHRGWAMGWGAFWYDGHWGYPYESGDWDDVWKDICAPGGIPTEVRPKEPVYVPLRVYDGGGDYAYIGLEWMSVIKPDGSWTLLPRSDMPNYPRSTLLAWFELGQVMYPVDPIEDSPERLDLTPYMGSDEGEWAPAPTAEYAVHDGILHLYGTVEVVGTGDNGDGFYHGIILDGIPEGLQAVSPNTNTPPFSNIQNSAAAYVVRGSSGRSWTCYTIHHSSGTYVFIIVNVTHPPIVRTDEVKADHFTLNRVVRGAWVDRPNGMAGAAKGGLNHGPYFKASMSAHIEDGGGLSIMCHGGGYEMHVTRVAEDLVAKLYRNGSLVKTDLAGNRTESQIQHASYGMETSLLSDGRLKVSMSGIGGAIDTDYFDTAPLPGGSWHISKSAGTLVWNVEALDFNRTLDEYPDIGETIDMTGIFWPTVHPGREELPPTVINPSEVVDGPVNSGIVRHLRTVGSRSTLP